MPLVINALRGGHTDTHTRIPTHGPKQFQETRHARPKRTPGLKTYLNAITTALTMPYLHLNKPNAATVVH